MGAKGGLGQRARSGSTIAPRKLLLFAFRQVCCNRPRGNDISAAQVDQVSTDPTRDEAPAGDGWLHEIKYDGYRVHARIAGRDSKLLTRTGLARHEADDVG